MVARGLIDEAARLLRKGYSPALPSLATVGYAEAFAHLQGRTSGEEMLRLFKQNSRRYAKRQITWFNADRRIRWVEMVPGRSEAEAAAEIRDAYLSLLQTREETQ
jgi:tRNA dimethylallyltransferase